MNDYLSRTKEILLAHLPRGAEVVLGVSGGADSMCLLYIVMSMARRRARHRRAPSGRAWRVIVAHVNYGMRGAESDADAALVAKMCKKYGARFELKKAKISGKGNFEVRARLARHLFFDAIAAKHKAAKILIAHNEDDQLETIMFNLFRGAGKRGESGMAVSDGMILRPLLHWSREEVRAFCAAKKIAFRDDATNADTNYSRNRLRLEIIPQLQKTFPQFRSSFLKNAQLARNEDDFLDLLVLQFIGKFANKTGRGKSQTFKFDKAIWAAADPVIQRRAIRLLHKDKYGDLHDIRQKHVDEVMELLDKAVTGKRKKFGRGEWQILREGLRFE